MPMTAEQLDNWFSYHQPTDETAPKYAAIRETEAHVVASITQAHFENVGTVALYGCVNAACKRFAVVIDTLAPDSADKTAAIRCVRLARNLFNEWGTEIGKDPAARSWANPQDLFVAAELELVKARMQANSAIACGGR